MDKNWDSKQIRQVQDLARAYTHRRRRAEMYHIDWEAVEMAAVCGGLEAIETYDPARNTKLSSWMVTKIKAAILQELRKQDYLSRYQRDRAREEMDGTEVEPLWARVPISMQLLGRDDWGEFLGEQIEDLVEDHATGPEALTAEKLGAEWVRDLLRYLPPRHAAVIRLKFFCSMSHAEVAEELGISQRHLCTVQREALDRLRYVMEGLKEMEEIRAA